jgi:MFS family permease
VSNLGDGVYMVALPLLAARLTRDETEVAMVAAAAMLPWLVLSLPVGGLVDRFDRRRIMITADLVRAVTIGGFTALVAAGEAEIWMLWIVTLVLGSAEVFFDNASQAILPGIVTAEQLPVANGRRFAVEFATNSFVGVPLGGVLFAAAVWLPFGIDAASFLIAALLIATIGGDHRPAGAAARAATRPTTLRTEVAEGLGHLWRDPVLRPLAITLGLTNLAFQIPQSVFVLFAQDLLGIGERAFGLVLVLLGLGGIAGGLLGPRIVAALGPAGTIRVAVGSWVASLALTWAVPEVWVVAVTMAASSMAATVWNVVTISLRQEIVPGHLFGRVNSVYRFFGWGTLPIGSLLGGVVATLFGLRATWLVGAAAMAAALVVALRRLDTVAIEASRRRVADHGATTVAVPADVSRSADDDTPVALEREPFDDL